jgi:diacylglycerol kinase (CTP)
MEPVAAEFSIRSDLHLPRRVWHIVMGLTIVGIYHWLVDRPTALMILGSFLTSVTLIEVVRLRVPSFNKVMVTIFSPFVRASEIHAPSGAIYYLLGAFICVAVFPKTIAVLALAFLACGDPSASVSGILTRKWGYRLKSGKSLIGTLVCALVCSVVTWVYLGNVQAAIFGGIVGALAEITTTPLDDNLTIPVIAGFGLWLAVSFFGI